MPPCTAMFARAATSSARPATERAADAASKAFVQSFSEAVHAELRGNGVSVTTLSPGFTRTEFGKRANAAQQESALPDALFMDADEVAYAGVEAMLAGRRTVTPGLHNRASAFGGRVVPRSLLFPLFKRMTRAG